MEITERDKVFETICAISDRNVDPAVKVRLREFIGRENADIKDELLGLIDDIVFCAWTSDFELNVLHVVWLQIGGSEQELLDRKPVDTPENQAKYKWQVCGSSHKEG